MNSLLKNLSDPLKAILQSELTSGNTIREVSSGWPDEDSIIVLLATSFKRVYLVADFVQFREVNDRHYWKAEYYDSMTKHMLVCGFE